METLQRTANRGSISTGYDIENSLKLERANSEAIAATNSTQSGNRKTWTFSTWIKRTEISYSGAFGVVAIFYAASSGIRFESTDKLGIRLYTSGGLAGDFLTTQVFRDTSAWYHIVLTVDSTEATSSNRVKLWINGEQVTDFGTETYPNLNDEFQFGEAQSAAPIRIGNAYWGTSPFSAYIAETHYLNGTAKQASDFGEYDADSGIWIPKEYTDGGYGDIGFYYKYDNASSLGEDSSGEGHDASALSNITSADQATDTPTNNFCTLNVISAIGDNTYTEGATKGIANAQNEQAEGTFMINKGKWYFEAQNITSAGAMFGFGKPNNWATGNPNNPGNDTSSFAIANDGNVYYNSNTAASGWASYATTDKAMIAVDLDNGFCYFGKNGTWGNSGDPTSGATGTGGFNYVSLVTNISLGDELVPALRISYTQTHGAMFNFGGYTVMSISSAVSDANGYGTFEYAPPSGYYALCTKNLAEYG